MKILPNAQPARGNQPGIQVLLFDLGGVVVDFDGIAPLLALSNGRLTREEARRFWLFSPSVRSFEIGKCTPEEFARGALAELGLELSPDFFLREFLAWDRGPMAGALELLDALRPRFLLACLSNNNELHWARLRAETRLAERFHRCYLSQEIGLIKPDGEIFEYVLRDLALPPAQILFLDDNPECVEAGRSAGLAACQVRGVQEARAALSSLGCLGLCEG
jgi:HAD superfamily hydrolase (TIGR01509 family)